LVAQTRDSLLSTENVQHIENTGRCRLAGEGGPERLRHFAKLHPGLLGIGPYRSLEPLRRPGLYRFEPRQQRRKRLARGLVQELLGLGVELERPLGEEIVSAVEQLDQVGPEQVDVEIPVAGLALGDNAVMPTVRSPRGTTVLSITPETVRVTVAEAP